MFGYKLVLWHAYDASVDNSLLLYKSSFLNFSQTIISIANNHIIGSVRATAQTLGLSWTVSGIPNRFEVTYSYTVKRCSAPQGTPCIETISDGSVRLHTLRNLSEDSSYTITVRAIGTVGLAVATRRADTSTSGKFNLLYIKYFFVISS